MSDISHKKPAPEGLSPAKHRNLAKDLMRIAAFQAKTRRNKTKTKERSRYPHNCHEINLKKILDMVEIMRNIRATEENLGSLPREVISA
jgi:hypothetical protein